MRGMRQARGAVIGILALIIFLASMSSAHASEFIMIQPVIAGPLGAATPNISNDLLFTWNIFAQASIDVVFRPTLANTSLPANLTQDDPGFLTFFTDVTFQNPPILTVWFVATIDSSADYRGSSYCYGSVCGVWVANSAVNDTLAHEMAHVLTDFYAYWYPRSGDISHSTDANNLLAYGQIRNGQDLIEPIQVAAMFQSPYVQTEAVPEPATTSLLWCGILLILPACRRHRARSGSRV